MYAQCDTLLLADEFEKFKDMCIEIYELDPAYFVSAPGLAWLACLKNTEVKLELLTDPDMLLMVEEEIRGGICQAMHRYAKANNKYMKNYDENIESSYLSYLDANNLYGWPTCEKRFVAGFKWVEDLSQFNDYFIKNYDKNSDKGYILEVHIDYPKKLFSLHKDFPFLPEKKIGACEKLICDIKDKEKYAVYMRALKQALNRGLKLKREHKVIQCNQKAWMKPYI